MTRLLNAEEAQRIIDKAGEMRWKQGEPVPATYGVVLRALRWTACHPSVLSQKPRKGAPVVKEEKGVAYMEWRRPKTGLLCLMPIPGDLAAPLRSYLARPFSVRMIQKICETAGLNAGFDDVTPRSFRKLRGLEVFIGSGPARAKSALGVSDEVLRHYAVMSEKEAMLKLSRDFAPRRRSRKK